MPPDFFQVEGIVLGSDINFRTLLGLLNLFAREVAQAKEVKFLPAYFPFTEQAIACYRRAQIVPESAMVRTDLAKLLFETGDARGAREQFLEVRRLETGSADAANNLAVLEASEGNLDAAIRLWEEALRAAPGHVDAQQNLRKALALRDGARSGSDRD